MVLSRSADGVPLELRRRVLSTNLAKSISIVSLMSIEKT